MHRNNSDDLLDHCVQVSQMSEEELGSYALVELGGGVRYGSRCYGHCIPADKAEEEDELSFLEFCEDRENS